jgi:hypothetical protein
MFGDAERAKLLFRNATQSVAGDADAQELLTLVTSFALNPVLRSRLQRTFIYYYFLPRWRNWQTLRT